MSDAVRMYSGRKHNPKKSRGRGRRRWVLLTVLLVMAAAFFWTTRDTHTVHSLAPENRAYHVMANDIFARRARLAQSQVWNAAPPQLDHIPQVLAQDIGVPQWILNNLVPDACLVAGNDVQNFSDALFLTRMTRVGAMLEKMRRFVPSFGSERAGGLNLRRIDNIYYAVRGRVLLVSASRQGLIEALTLLPEDALSADEISAMTQTLGQNDVYGRFQLAQNDPMGDILEGGTFAIRVGQDAASVKCAVVVRPEWRRLSALLDDVAPAQLKTPPDGIMRLSLDLGKPVEALWSSAAAALGRQDEMEQLWAGWTTTPNNGEPGLAQVIVGLLANAGPGLRLSLLGIDLDEIIPAPEIVAVADADRVALTEAFTQLPAPPAGTQSWEMWPRYDEEAGVVRLPLIGGPSLEPTAAVRGSNLVVSSSRLIAETFMGLPETANPQTLPEPANLYAEIKPHELGKVLFDTAVLLAEAGMLRGHSPQTLHEQYAPWLANAAAVKRLTATAAYDSGELAMQLSLKCAQQPE